MRAGYLMHRFVHRLFGGDACRRRYSTDGAEMGKQMVAEGLGVTVLPDYSVDGDPLVRAGVITHRPIAGDRRRSRSCSCTAGSLSSRPHCAGFATRCSTEPGRTRRVPRSGP